MQQVALWQGEMSRNEWCWCYQRVSGLQRRENKKDMLTGDTGCGLNVLSPMIEQESYIQTDSEKWNRAVMCGWNEAGGHSGSAALLSLLIWRFLNCAIGAAVNAPDSAVSLQRRRQNPTVHLIDFLKMSHRASLDTYRTCHTEINSRQGSAFIDLCVFVATFSFKLIMLMCCIDFYPVNIWAKSQGIQWSFLSLPSLKKKSCLKFS